ncbi:MAG: DUF6046 domain-containing protein [Rikenellaceae bacterium]
MSDKYKVSRFELGSLLMNFIGYKGIPYPGGYIPTTPPKYDNGADYSHSDTASNKTSSALGSTLRKQDSQGRWYFMPIELNNIEIPNSIISIKGKKTIVETAMVGRKGTVKELISVDDYEITIAGVLLDTDWPDEAIAELKDLYSLNESISLKCALTDIFLEDDDSVVIKSIEFPEMKGYECSQIFKMSLVTDRSFELTIE